MRGLSLVAASGGHSQSQCVGLSPSRPLLLRSTGSRRAGSVVVAHGPNCSASCGIFPDQGLNLCPLHWQADSQPLRHQGSPTSSHLLVQWFSECGLWTSNLSITWELVRNANSWAPPHTFSSRNSGNGAQPPVLTSPPGDAIVSPGLRTAALVG